MAQAFGGKVVRAAKVMHGKPRRLHIMVWAYLRGWQIHSRDTLPFAGGGT